MRLSKLNMNKINVGDISNNCPAQDILMKLGELYQFESGIYGLGNILVKMQRIVEKIIIEELDKADCIQVQFPTLQPKSIWNRSNRWDTYTKDTNTMFTINSDLGDYGLAPTAEECATIFGANRLTSYKSLPTIYYQIGEKFRKEIRTRGYLFRPRTFTMMDAYSFDTNEEEMHKTFNKMHDVYMQIFNRIGIHIIPVISDGGTMGGRVSEEYQALTEFGEDIILYDKNKNIGLNKEVLEFEDKDTFIKASGVSNVNDLEEYHSIELGNNFELGTKYSRTMNLNFIDTNGEEKPYYMGCYGIGVGRIIAVILENSIIKKDNKILGISLPEKIAPYKLQIIYKDNKQQKAEELYQILTKENIDTIIDDRQDLSLGNRIKDAYIIGTPYILILGDKTENDNYELENTKTSFKEIVDLDSLIEKLKRIYS